ncbi:hypothetical protein [Pseudomonas aeruginosa]
MSLQTDTAERLLTWLDVERVLKQRSALWTQLPTNVLSVDCFANGLEVRHVADDGPVDDWLSQVFGHAYQRDQRFIRLRIGEACYPVELIRDSGSVVPASGQNYPLWRDVTYLPIDEAASETLDMQPLIQPMVNTPTVWTQGPDLVSFHSFKGGVGRTTALMTYVAACIQEPGPAPKKILVVDADLEAPGVSFWLILLKK